MIMQVFTLKCVHANAKINKQTLKFATLKTILIFAC